MKRLIVILTIVLTALFSVKAQDNNLKIGAFKNVIISYPAKVDIVYSPEYSIEIVDSSSSKVKVLIFEETSNGKEKSKDLGHFTIKQKDSTLYIERKADISTDFGKVRILIKAPKLENIRITTATSVKLSGKFNLEKLNIYIEGASDIKLLGDPKIKHLSVKNEGASYFYVKLKNPIDIADLDIEGASYFSALETPINHVIAKVEGASICKIYPIQELNVKVEGMSLLIYKGKPQKEYIKSEGLSIVKQAD